MGNGQKNTSKTEYLGICNLGNTCYISSVILLLLHTGLQDKLKSKEPITHALFNLMRSLASNSTDLITNNFRNFIKELSKKSPKWGNKSPQDAKDFFLTLYNYLSLESTNLDDLSWNLEKSLSFKCKQNHIQLINQNINLLQIYNNGSLRDSIDETIKNFEKSYKNNENYCETCGVFVKSHVQTKVLRFPMFYCFYRDLMVRLNEMPEEIEKISISKVCLEIIGFISMKEVRGRHFTAVCKEKTNWVEYDDNKVRCLSPKKLQSLIRSIYIIIYKKTS